MTQYSDASFTFTVEGELDLTSVTHPHLTIGQGETVIDITDINILDAGNFTAELDQEQTALLRPGTAEIQLNFFINGKRRNTDKALVNIDGNLLRRVISDG